jgi:phospholipase/lecithinase/hemolysin
LRSIREKQIATEEGLNIKRAFAVTTSSRQQNRLTALCTVFCLVFLVGSAPASFARGDHEGVELLIFGDSLSDTGNAAALGAGITFRPFEALIPSGPYVTLRFTNGRTWVEHLAKKIGAPDAAKAVFLFPEEGRNYAVGGGRARSVPGSFNLPEQVGQFLSSTDSALTGRDLVVTAFGGNDVRDAIVEFGSVLASGGAEQAAQLAATQILCQAVASIEENIALLHDTGARKFLVTNSPNIGTAPAITILEPQSPGISMLGTELSALFNLLLVNGDTPPLPGTGGLGICALNTVSIQGLSALESSLRGIDVVLFDVFTLLTEVVADPQAFDLSNGTDACITPGVFFGAICREPWEYVFWDGIHPTTAMHRIVAREAGGLLPVASFAGKHGKVRRHFKRR